MEIFKLFKKIKLDMPNIDQLKIKGELFEDHGTFVMFEIKDKAYLNEILSNVLTFNINPDKISFIEISNDGLCPHTDGYVGCSLNYVLEDSESITVFWKLAKKSFSPELAKKLKDGSYKPTETKGHNYSDLEYVCSFKSTQGDAHLIDVRNIHSVEKYKCTVKRKLLSFRWDPKYNLEEIYNSIRIVVNPKREDTNQVKYEARLISTKESTHEKQ